MPLLIPRFPLAIIAALIIDAVDNSILAAFTSVDLGPDGPYQSFDKALDIYYLAIAYTTTLRNWTNLGAVRVAQFLFYYRLVGVLLFELTHERTLLLIFPNTFEYFFIAYEAIRLRFDPARRSTRFWIITAGVIWVFVKLPQEYWIHVAQLDFTETVDDHPWFGDRLRARAAGAGGGVLVRGAAAAARPGLGLALRGRPDARAGPRTRSGPLRADREGDPAGPGLGDLRGDAADGEDVGARGRDRRGRDRRSRTRRSTAGAAARSSSASCSCSTSGSSTSAAG